MTDVPRAKATLRRRMRSRLGTTPDRVRAAAGDTVRSRLLALPEVASARGVFTCLSFGREIDTWVLVDELLASGRRVVVPRATRGERDLHVHPYPCALERSSFGLRQPVATEPELAPDAIDEVVDVALVLGLAFDETGVRLGYGAGYFDRFLVGRPFPAVGVAFETQVTDALPHESHDVPMDVVVTEEKVRRPPRARRHRGSDPDRRGDPS